MEPTKAAIYCRISSDSEDTGLGVARQEEDCRALAEKLGYTVENVYTDNDIGASTRTSKKSRPQYTAMLQGARAGSFGVILSYSNSRLTRRPKELEDLIALYEVSGVALATVVSGQDDLGTADGRMVARIKGSIDAAESERLSERVSRKLLELAGNGQVSGGCRPFGWRADYVTLEPVEADAIRAAARCLLEGDTLRRVASEFNEAKLTTPFGNGWSGKTVRAMILKPRLAGWRVHRGAIMLDKEGAPVRGVWEPILSQETADALQTRLRYDETRTRKPRRGARHYLMTGLLRCGGCGGPMYGNRTATGFNYRCDKDGIAGVGPAIDEVVGALILKRLEGVDLTDAATTTPPATDARLEDISGQINELMDAFTARRLSAGVVFGAVEALEKERDSLTAARRIVTPRGPRLTHLTPEAWVALDTDRQRAVAEVLLEAVVLRPAPRHTNRFDSNRIDPIWLTE